MNFGDGMGYEYAGDDVYGGYGGGGFAAMDMMGGTAFNGMGTNAPSSGGKDDKNRFNDSLTPVTIKQLHDATKNNPSDDSVQIDNNAVRSVMIMGIVKSCSHHTVNVEYMIDDGTGIIKCSKYLENEASPVAYPGELEFVKVIGRIKKYSGDSWSMTIFHVAKVTDMNEITHHLLEVMYTHLQRTKGPISSLGGVGVKPISMGTPSGFKQQVLAGSSSNKVAEQILDILKSCEDQMSGMHVREIIHLMKVRHSIDLSQQNLNKELDMLSNSGSVYTTIDDEHYLPS